MRKRAPFGQQSGKDPRVGIDTTLQRYATSPERWTGLHFGVTWEHHLAGDLLVRRSPGRDATLTVSDRVSLILESQCPGVFSI